MRMGNEISKENEIEKREKEEEMNGVVVANKMLMDYQKESRRSGKRKDIIIIVLIICMLIEALGFYAGFLWYESQFETTVEETKTIEMNTDGDNAEISNNDITN